jgi:hypothetical protein
MSTWGTALPNRLTALSFSSVVASRLSSPLSGPPTATTPWSPAHEPLLCLIRRCPGVSMIGRHCRARGRVVPSTGDAQMPCIRAHKCSSGRCVEAMRNNGPRNTRRDATNASVPTGCALYTRALPSPADAPTYGGTGPSIRTRQPASPVQPHTRSCAGRGSPAGPLRAGDRTITTTVREPRSVEAPQHVAFQFE